MIVTVVGIGLIGGSMALDLKKRGFADQVIGVDKNEENKKIALQNNLVDKILDLETAVSQSDIIVLAIPVGSMVTLLPNILDLITEKQMVTEVGSTKEIVLKSIDNHPKRGRFLSSHPMAGTEFSGPTAAVYNLFEDKCNVFIDEKYSDADVITTFHKLFNVLGMNNVNYNSEEHDLHTAYVSHISHISSFALALTVLAKEKKHNRIFELASGGFGSTVRLAKSSPDMWIPIFEQNRDNVLDVLDEHINQLAQFRSLLIKKDFKTFYSLIEESNQIKKILK